MQVLPEGLPELAVQASEGLLGEGFGQVEEIDEDADEGMHLLEEPLLGAVRLEAAPAPEVAFFHDAFVELALPARAYGGAERHLPGGQAQTADQEVAKGLPRLHDVHRFKIAVQLVQIELPMVAVQGDGHVAQLSQSHARGQEMVPGVEEGEEHHEFLGGHGYFEAFPTDTPRFVGEAFLLDGSRCRFPRPSCSRPARSARGGKPRGTCRA